MSGSNVRNLQGEVPLLIPFTEPFSLNAFLRHSHGGLGLNPAPFEFII